MPQIVKKIDTRTKNIKLVVIKLLILTKENVTETKVTIMVKCHQTCVSTNTI